MGDCAVLDLSHHLLAYATLTSSHAHQACATPPSPMAFLMQSRMPPQIGMPFAAPLRMAFSSRTLRKECHPLSRQTLLRLMKRMNRPPSWSTKATPTFRRFSQLVAV